MRVILASASPRRKELMALLQMPFEIITSGIEEKVTKTVPSEVVEELSLQKAEDVFCKLTGDASQVMEEDLLVIGADTVVAIDGKILGKPTDEKDAEEMLQLLSGRGHEVFTGVSMILYHGGKVSKQVFSVRTEVVFRSLTPQEIRDYIQTKEPMDKAGSYGIQGFGAKFVKEIHGDYFNVVGLPVSEIYEHLREI